MIRSNPGLILLKNGTILSKWSRNQLPEEEQIAPEMDNLLQKGIAKSQQDGRILPDLLGFTLPLLLVYLYDYSRHRKRGKKTKTTENNN